jgi:hypothetical protein
LIFNLEYAYNIVIARDRPLPFDSLARWPAANPPRLQSRFSGAFSAAMPP